MSTPLYHRDFDELPAKDKAKIRAIKTVDDIRSTEVLDTWHDDHQICFGCKLNGVVFGWWWSSADEVAAMKYAMSSPIARHDLVTYLHSHLERFN